MLPLKDVISRPTITSQPLCTRNSIYFYLINRDLVCFAILHFFLFYNAESLIICVFIRHVFHFVNLRVEAGKESNNFIIRIKLYARCILKEDRKIFIKRKFAYISSYIVCVVCGGEVLLPYNPLSFQFCLFSLVYLRSLKKNYIPFFQHLTLVTVNKQKWNRFPWPVHFLWGKLCSLVLALMSIGAETLNSQNVNLFNPTFVFLPKNRITNHTKSWTFHEVCKMLS